jgi:hypothetical protein
MGSLVVKEGCIFLGFEGIDFQGNVQTLEGPLVYPNGIGFDPNPIPGYGSMKCQCSF